MREAGKVVKVEDGVAYLLFIRTSACAKCGACGMIAGQNSITIQINDNLSVKQGDKVEVEFTSRNALQSSLIAYIFPLIMLILGVFIGYVIPQKIFETTDVFAAIMGIIFAVAAFVIIKLLNPVLEKRFSNVYTMVRIMDER